MRRGNAKGGAKGGAEGCAKGGARRTASASSANSAQRGFTFIAVLAAMLLLALAAQQVMSVLSAQAQRIRTEESARFTKIYAEAIQSYYDATPGVRKQYPEQLEDLLLDQRQVSLRRHLRRLYPDPLQPNLPAHDLGWGLERDARGHIQAVFSTAKAPAWSRP